ncbi:hypothetical protein ACFL0J_04980 [Candidatus Neomarinimicrobiota bacterium]
MNNISPMIKKFFPILIINCSLTIILIILTAYFNNNVRFHYATLANDLRYIEHALQYRNHIYFEALTNSINPPVYPIFFYLISYLTMLIPTNIVITQWILLFFAISFLSFELFKKYKSYSMLFSIFLFTYLNPIFFILNDGGVFPEFFTTCLVFIIISLWLRFTITRTNSSVITFSIVSGLLILTRYEFIILIALVAFQLFKKFRFKQAILYISFPLVLLCFNLQKNYLIYDDIKLTNYSLHENMYGGVLTDGGLHYIDAFNFREFIPERFQEEFQILEKDTIDVNRILKKDKLFFEMWRYQWETNFWGKINVLPCKFLKLIVPPPTIDIYTSNPEIMCKLNLENYFSDYYFPLKKDRIINIVVFVFHFTLLSLTAYSLYKNTLFKDYSPFILFILIYSFLLTFLFYGLPRFNFNLYAIFIVIQSLLFRPRLKN